MGLIQDVAARVAGDPGHGGPAGVARSAGRLLAIEAPLAPTALVGEVVDRIIGLGPLQPLIGDTAVTDILVNGPSEIWVDRGDDLELTDIRFSSVGDLMATVERALAGLGVRVDRSSPMVDGRLSDGSRIHVVVPPAAVGHPVVAIRRFSPVVRSLAEVEAARGLKPEERATLELAVAERKNIIVSGGTGSGKTTLLNVLAAEIPSGQRTVTVEDAAELDLPGHVVRLEGRPANAEGFGEITIRQLLRSALRLRPDRIVLGEVRGNEALDLLTALNTGHRGSMSTVHANSPEEVLWRLETLALIDGAASPNAVRRQLHAAIDLVVQLSRVGNLRRVESMAIVGPDGNLETP